MSKTKTSNSTNKGLILAVVTLIVGLLGFCLLTLSGLHLESVVLGSVDYSLLACIFGNGSALLPGVNAGLLTGFIFGVVGILLSAGALKVRGLSYLAFACYVASSTLFLCIFLFVNPFLNLGNTYTYGVGSIIMAISQLGACVLSI